MTQTNASNFKNENTIRIIFALLIRMVAASDYASNSQYVTIQLANRFYKITFCALCELRAFSIRT